METNILLNYSMRTKEENLQRHMEARAILKPEVRLASSKMNRTKVAIPDGIVIEIHSVLDDFRINKISKINLIYDSGKILGLSCVISKCQRRQV